MRHRRTLFRSTTIVALALAAGWVGCGDDATGTSEARVSATVHDQNPQTQSASLASLLALQSSAAFSGTVSGDARVEVSADGDTWVQLEDAAGVDVQLQSSDGETTVHSDVSVPVESVAHVRLVLSGAEAQIEAGSTVGGLTLDSGTTLALGSSGEIVIEKQLEQSVDLTADSDARVSFDLNSEAWVTQDNVEATAVPESEIEGAATVQATGSSS